MLISKILFGTIRLFIIRLDVDVASYTNKKIKHIWPYRSNSLALKRYVFFSVAIEINSLFCLAAYRHHKKPNHGQVFEMHWNLAISAYKSVRPTAPKIACT